MNPKEGKDFQSGSSRREENRTNRAATNSGAEGAASNSGAGGAASNSGAGGAASNSGAGGAASNSGAGGAASNSGAGGAASNSGAGGAASNNPAVEGAVAAASNQRDPLVDSLGSHVGIVRRIIRDLQLKLGFVQQYILFLERQIAELDNTPENDEKRADYVSKINIAGREEDYYKRSLEQARRDLRFEEEHPPPSLENNRNRFLYDRND